MRSFAKEGAAAERYSAAQGECLQWGLRTALLEGWFFALSGTFANSCIITILWYGALKVDTQLPVLNAASAVVVVNTTASPLLSCIGLWEPCTSGGLVLRAEWHLCQ